MWFTLSSVAYTCVSRKYLAWSIIQNYTVLLLQLVHHNLYSTCNAISSCWKILQFLEHMQCILERFKFTCGSGLKFYSGNVSVLFLLSSASHLSSASDSLSSLCSSLFWITVLLSHCQLVYISARFFYIYIYISPNFCCFRFMAFVLEHNDKSKNCEYAPISFTLAQFLA